MKKSAKIIACALVVLLTCFVQVILGKNTGLQNKSEDVHPPLFDTPSYVELYDGNTLNIELTAKESCHMGSMSVVLVNTNPEGKGTISFVLDDASGNEIWTAELGESSVVIGEWTGIGNTDFYLEEGVVYRLLVTANGCDPFFIKTQLDATNKVLPFSESIEGVDTGISLGTTLISDKPLTYADVFYHSRILSVILGLALICFIVFGYGRSVMALRKVPELKVLEGFGSDIFLGVLFITLCFSIWINGYLEGINISADSAGYLREAVNMAAGNGFHYDGIAGYKSSWFANWPILYPAMIALMMKITGLEVYAASKVLSMVLVGVLILILRITYKKDAWFYAMFMTNLGLMYLYWYSWSELPFIIFMVLFALSLHRVLVDNENRVLNYAFLGISAFLCFLTRYFGIFTYFVIGLYMALLIADNIWGSKKADIRKIVYMGITAFISGCMCILYMLNNKIQNGMPSGVSRSMWWDDYQTLTGDLVKALLAEIFNVFHIDVPSYISGLSYGKSVLIVLLVIVILAVFVLGNAKKFSRESVFVTTGVVYYGMFIVIRYFSSMDTFYYRFFAPASFLLTLGIAGLLLGKMRNVRFRNGLLLAVIAFVCIFGWSDYAEHIRTNKLPYYDIVQMNWDGDYAEIPDRSVVIFSTLDYRSQYYRPDVVEGTISPEDTMDSLKERYFGSSQMCILTSDATAMVDAGIYDNSINKAITDNLDDAKKYCVITLN
ncbi:glycosyltransferase family 39 protein [Butyrivibrio sp. VCB2006]|uniref:glycosyltransferase family 39 protein n=1 Tax=Butyrivibrio sp. VCB2006 TaxID=1280679 RepID=UPI00042702B3|nr:glycosyltransferase family 39 protein [Butyrivibrio sp. VCB2006]